MKLLFSISLLLISSFAFSQKITLTIKKDTLETIDSLIIDDKYNGFYATEYEQVVVNVDGTFLTLKAKCFMEVKNDSCWVIQENISNKTAKKLFKKGGFFESKNTIVGCFKSLKIDSEFVEKMGNETKSVFYLNLFQQEFGKFYRSTSIKNSDNFKVFFSKRINDKRQLIGMPVHIKSKGGNFPPNGIYTAIYYTFIKLD